MVASNRNWLPSAVVMIEKFLLCVEYTVLHCEFTQVKAKMVEPFLFQVLRGSIVETMLSPAMVEVV